MTSVTYNPAERIALHWTSINYTLEKYSSLKDRILRGKKVSKTILNNVSGCIKSGELVAIMGPSGSGKTSLLSILADRVENYTGSISVNGVMRDKNFRRWAAYVQQEDMFYGTATPREVLECAAALRSSVPKNDQPALVDQLLVDLGLQKCAETRIGTLATRGISGGEKKRLSIGVELTTQPVLLMLDEPTTGLDSATAFSVVKLLRQLADRGAAVLVTLHQPRHDIFTLFDKLILMHSGRVVYEGLTSEAQSHFARYGYECDPHTNPADFFLDLIKEHGDELADKNSSSQQKLTADETYSWKPQAAYKASWWTQYLALVKRAWRHTVRDELILISTMAQYILYAVLSVLAWWRLTNDQEGVRNRIAAIVWIVAGAAFVELFAATTYFPAERPLFDRERGTTATAHLPQELVGSVTLIVITYFTLGLQLAADKFFVFLLVMVILIQTSSGLGISLTMALPSYLMSNMAANLIFNVWMLFSGIFIEGPNIPKYLRWLQYTSFMKFSIDALMQNEFQGRNFTCPTAPEGTCLFPTSGSADIRFPNGTSQSLNHQPAIQLSRLPVQ